jgi:cellulose synthase/poly-beta-1,6-N-acetylglucosamine synthase-like glycosyltransferase
VGAVCGELNLFATTGANVDSTYWRMERSLKKAEARLGGLLGANGAIYAIRRELWKPLPADTICEDFVVAMGVAAQGLRVAYAEAALAHEETPEDIHDEYGRRVRIGIGNYQALFEHPEFLMRTGIATRFTYVSHKVLRWIAPHLVIVAMLASALAATFDHAWRLPSVLLLVGSPPFSSR